MVAVQNALGLTLYSILWLRQTNPKLSAGLASILTPRSSYDLRYRARTQRSSHQCRGYAGTYQINQEKFNSALDLFRRERFRAARDETGSVQIGARRCAQYSSISLTRFTRGWGRAYFDQELFKQDWKQLTEHRLASASPLTVDD